MKRLRSNGDAVRLGRYVLRTPGLEGEATLYEPRPGGGLRKQRAIGAPTDLFDEAMSRAGLTEVATIAIDHARDVRLPRGHGRSLRGATALELQAPRPSDEQGQMVLFVDEEGVSHWSFPIQPPPSSPKRGGGVLRYELPRRPTATGAPATEGKRCFLGALGKKLLKVFVFRLIDKAVGEIAEGFAAMWERKHRSYELRSFLPGEQQTEPAAPLDKDALKALSGGRALLFIHGTFSRTPSAFGDLPDEFLRDCHRLYDGRVASFDHFTLSEDPRQNVDWLMNQVGGIDLDLDIVAHSRGGLVARVLAERTKVSNIVFVASPNAGTILVDKKYLGDFIDTYTTILNLFPPVGALDVLETVIAVVKELAVGALGGLPGLQAMLPDGPFLEKLNSKAPSRSECFGVASNFEPPKGKLWAWARDWLADTVFEGRANDLVVPTKGVYEVEPGHPLQFKEHRVFEEERAVSHCQYFRQPETRTWLLTWLAAGLGR